MLGAPKYRRHRLQGGRKWCALAGMAGEHLSVAALLYGLELAHVGQRLVPFARVELALGWVLLAIALAVAAVIVATASVRAKPRSVDRLDAAHRRVVEQAAIAAKQPLPGAIEGTLEAGCHGLGVLLDDWVHWALEEDVRPPGLSKSGSFWSCRVGCNGESLIFTTGGVFSEQEMLVLERIEEFVDLLLRHGPNFGDKS